MFLIGRSLREIGRSIGVDHKTVKLHLEEKIKPLWESDIRRRAGEFLAEVRLLKRKAWEMLLGESAFETGQAGKRRTGTRKLVDRNDAVWLKAIQWCLETERNVLSIEVPPLPAPGYRVAGRSPEQIRHDMANRIIALLERSRRERAEQQANEESP